MNTRTMLVFSLVPFLLLFLIGCAEEQPAADDDTGPGDQDIGVDCSVLTGADQDRCCMEELDDIDAFFDVESGDCQILVEEDPDEDVLVPDYQVVGDFCGTSTEERCDEDRDCQPSGCSSQVCGAVENDVATTCEYRLCYNPDPYGLRCGCLNSLCQWSEG